jgi:glycine cleavage system H protein
VQAGATFGEVESVKAVSDLYSPVSGVVTQVNEALADDLSALSDDAFGRGWIAKLKIQDAAQFDRLMDYAAYQTHCRNAAH